ncbi:uncharacterized protein LY89DRAFT_153773 [Mollisia scopiformis]|uniref:Uncharacterized protein n=1 Tax=Mollisia scopiformis TaxID=149040 RepID=A0A194WYY6_MOLSC|nr:uncharacterized protein LY89DRAFT_153773 [Mollisia scopiformis]KUJ13176.1 hypothetical protein LY89DRAFT_153773 [Mollisia scopiformis]
MADPFGTGAGIVGVIGLAIQITQVVVQFGIDWKDAPENVKTFMAELGTLKTVLSETNTNIILNPDFAAAFQNRSSLLLSQLGPEAPLTTDTNLMLEICRRELDSMLKELKKRGQGHRLGWERLKGAFLAKDTRDSVENLCRQCQTLNNMLSIDAAALGATTYKEVREARKEQQDISLAIRGGVDESNRRQENQEQQHERQTILQWLTPVDYAAQQSDFIGRRQEGTGQWLLDSAQFRAWLETDKQTLFCPGIPGAGKTILTSIVVDELTTRICNDPTIGIAYLYCNFRRKDEQKAQDLLASLLKQLSEQRSSLPDSVKSLYGKHKEKRTRPSLEEMSRTLQFVASIYSRVIVVIDALDECQVSDGCRPAFLTEIFSLQLKTGANLFATSRFIPDITEKFKGSIISEIRAHNEDVRHYLDGRISQSGQKLLETYREEIKTEITKAVDGMFLLAQLHFESISTKKTLKKMKGVLKNLPIGPKAYDYAYEQAMQRILDHDADSEELAKQVLSWITCSKRPLSTSELQHALAVEVGKTYLDEENLPQLEDMVSVCAGLVTIDEESSIIRLVHYTTQEYFERTQKQWFFDAQTDITTICITYLSFNEFESGICQNDEDFEQRLQSNKLYDYAAHNWGYHTREASIFYPGIIDFLQKQGHVGASSQALIAVKRWRGDIEYSQEIPKHMTGLHLAAYFGVDDAVRALLNNNSPDLKDSYGQTPLSWAAKSGHEAMVKLLLDKGAELEAKSTYGQTPLSRAAGSGGHEAVVKLLLEKNAELETKDIENGQTPLSWAARNGHEAVVMLLLATDANVSIENKSGWTALQLAALGGHEGVVRLLVTHGAPDPEDFYGLEKLFS